MEPEHLLMAYEKKNTGRLQINQEKPVEEASGRGAWRRPWGLSGAPFGHLVFKLPVRIHLGVRSE